MVKAFRVKSEAIPGRPTTTMGLYLTALHEASKVLEGPVVSRLAFGVETASRKLSHPEMIGDAFAANPFS